jgi:hypothetical protein
MPDKDWRATFHYVQPSDGRTYDMTMCFRDHTAVLLADTLSAATVAADLDGWLRTKCLAMAPSALQLASIHVNHGGPFGPGEGDPAEAGESVINVNGTLPAGSGGPIPHGLCARVSLATNLASKRGRGRFHAPWPLWAENIFNPDTWDTSKPYWAAVVSFKNELLLGKDVTHDTIAHHYSLRVHSRADNTTRDVTAAQVRPQVSYLRSRLSAP